MTEPAWPDPKDWPVANTSSAPGATPAQEAERAEDADLIARLRKGDCPGHHGLFNDSADRIHALSAQVRAVQALPERWRAEAQALQQRGVASVHRPLADELAAALNRSEPEANTAAREGATVSDDASLPGSHPSQYSSNKIERLAADDSVAHT